MSNEKVKVESFDFKTFEPFDADTGSKVRTTKEFAMQINARLRPVFRDYKGSFVSPVFDKKLGRWVPLITLSFHQLDPSVIKDDDHMAFKSIETMKAAGSNIAERSKAMYSGFSNGRKFFPTEEAAAKFASLYADPQRVNWNTASGERTSRDNYGNPISENFINGIDIRKMMEAIYGSKTDDGDIIHYSATIMDAVDMVPGSGIPAKNWRLYEATMTDESISRFYDGAGIVVANGFDIITEDRVRR